MPVGSRSRLDSDSTNVVREWSNSLRATWVSWNNVYARSTSVEYTCTASSSANTSDLVWSFWNTGTTSSVETYTWDDVTTYETCAVWRAWNRAWEPTRAPVVLIPGRAQETPEERAAREAENRRRQAEQEARWKAADAERKEAKDRAQKLLLSVLNEEQRRDWVNSGFFFLHKGDKTYKITRGRSGNVELVGPDKQPLERYCAHPIQAVPDEDTALAQMMYLLYDEEAFIALANVHWTKQGFDGQKRGLKAPGRALVLPMPQGTQRQRQAA